MSTAPHTHLPPRSFVGAWPRLMRAETAAAYVDEVSVEAFRRAVGVHYPKPIEVRGKGQRWLREDLDATIDAIAGRPKRYPPEASGSNIFDAANVL